MNVMTVVVFLAIGAFTGWLGGNKFTEWNFGILKNVIVGALGGLLGGYLFNVLLFAAGGFIGSILIAGTGAVVLLYLFELYNKKRRPGRSLRLKP